MLAFEQGLGALGHAAPRNLRLHAGFPPLARAAQGRLAQAGSRVALGPVGAHCVAASFRPLLSRNAKPEGRADASGLQRVGSARFAGPRRHQRHGKDQCSSRPNSSRHPASLAALARPRPTRARHPTPHDWRARLLARILPNDAGVQPDGAHRRSARRHWRGCPAVEVLEVAHTLPVPHSCPATSQSVSTVAWKRCLIVAVALLWAPNLRGIPRRGANAVHASPGRSFSPSPTPLATTSVSRPRLPLDERPAPRCRSRMEKTHPLAGSVLLARCRPSQERFRARPGHSDLTGTSFVGATCAPSGDIPWDRYRGPSAWSNAEVRRRRGMPGRWGNGRDRAIEIRLTLLESPTRSASPRCSRLRGDHRGSQSMRLVPGRARVRHLHAGDARTPWLTGLSGGRRTDCPARHAGSQWVRPQVATRSTRRVRGGGPPVARTASGILDEIGKMECLSDAFVRADTCSQLWSRFWPRLAGGGSRRIATGSWRS